MSHPTDVEAAWQALTVSPSPETSALLAWIEEGGYTVEPQGGTVLVNQPAPVDHDTHQSSRDAAWQIVQVG